jgi:hypothetical protein
LEVSASPSGEQDDKTAAETDMDQQANHLLLGDYLRRTHGRSGASV